jgi:AcrR family transcriptional regulator
MENTAAFILEKVAPVFNRQGYVGTSLSDLTKATGLTKGAIYCNFSGKEDLALQAFQLNVKRVIKPLNQMMADEDSSIDKLRALVSYYRRYYSKAKEAGGCPLLNVGIDAQNNNPKLFEAAKVLGIKLHKGLTNVIRTGQEAGQIRKDIDAEIYAGNLYSMIEGSVFIAFTFGNEQHLLNMLDHIEHLIETDIKI